jgi:integrase/recombinase XerD
MSTAAVARRAPNKKSLIPAYESNLTHFKKGWTVDPHGKAKTPFEDVLQMFLDNRRGEDVRPNTYKLYQRYVGEFFDFMKKRYKHDHYQQVTHDNVEGWKLALQKSEYAEASRALIFRTVRTLFHWMKSNPTPQQFKLEHHLTALPKIKKTQGRVWIPMPVQLQQFLESFDQNIFWGFRDYVIASLITDCGARIGEVCNIKLENVRWEISMIQIPNEIGSKTGMRDVPIDSDTTIPLLRKWMRVREQYARPDTSGADRLFITRNSGQCTSDAMGKEWAKLRKAKGVGVEGEYEITPHVLRHYFCTWYLVNGGQIERLMQITGHTDMETVMIYVHMANQLKVVREEHKRVSPLKMLGENAGTKKKRKMN